jgi:hypothetical protein
MRTWIGSGMPEGPSEIICVKSTHISRNKWHKDSTGSYGKWRWNQSSQHVSKINFTYIIIITMAQQPYMGPGLLFSRLQSRAHSWQLVTGQLAALLFYRSWCARQSHLAGSQETPKEVVLRIFITLKNPSTSVGIEPANLGSSGEHANH